jgi:monooxygenase
LSATTNCRQVEEELDVLIVGAGLSGIGVACRLASERPTESFAILEARSAIGGTWDLFRYPGIRSDSDMYTLGYPFRPWDEDLSIAPGEMIRSYINQTAREFGVDRKVRFGRRAQSAHWSSQEGRWHLVVSREGEQEREHYSARFLVLCTGYYRYEEGFTPQLPNMEAYRGTLIHPQHWPEDLDCAGKRIVVVGSGATAVTLVPALAQRGAQVTMLQRTPTYIVSLPQRDPIAARLRARLPRRVAYRLVRAKNILLAIGSFQLARRRPALAKALIRKGIERRLPVEFPVDEHFKPPYDPWDQRLCLVPDGDLFKALSEGRAQIVTDRIERFTETGLELRSGAQLEADIVVLATGLNLLALGGIELHRDGERLELSEQLAYRGMMFADVPNAAFVVGYTNASWTLKSDLVATVVCRLLAHMERSGCAVCYPHNDDPTLEREPLIDLSSGYVMRAIDHFPKQGSRTPWRLRQNYVRDLLEIRRFDLNDGVLRFAAPGAPTPWESRPASAASAPDHDAPGPPGESPFARASGAATSTGVA